VPCPDLSTLRVTAVLVTPPTTTARPIVPRSACGGLGHAIVESVVKTGRMKRLIKQAFRSAGLELKRYDPRADTALNMKKMLSQNNIDMILDVGANTGQYAARILALGYEGRIVSFEPLGQAHAELVRRAARHPGWEVAERMAIGSSEGTIEINVSGNSISSSILPMLDAHSNASPDSVYISKETVPIRTLDEVLGKYTGKGDNLFLKIDTQGYEKQVLHGAKRSLASIRGIQLELSTLPLYEGQALAVELLQYLTEMHFELWSVLPGFTSTQDGRMLQFDGILFKS
jgi:FkbM family methyltransferase